MGQQYNIGRKQQKSNKKKRNNKREKGQATKQTWALVAYLYTHFVTHKHWGEREKKNKIKKS